MFLVAGKGTKQLWSGTGFIIEVNSKLYLITNNHVLGEEFKTSEYERLYNRKLPSDSIPDKILIRFYSKEFTKFLWRQLNIKRRGDTESIIKFWDNKSDSSTILDVVAIPIFQELIPELSQTIIFTETNLNKSLKLFPSLDLFVVGFPSDSGQLAAATPIWKRGTVASEANLIDIGSSTFWIDATTRGGMSGSPVVYRSPSFIDINGANNFTGLTTYLIGIYSAQNYHLELGVVTRLDKIFDSLKEVNK